LVKKNVVGKYRGLQTTENSGGLQMSF